MSRSPWLRFSVGSGKSARARMPTAQACSSAASRTAPWITRPAQPFFAAAAATLPPTRARRSEPPPSTTRTRPSPGSSSAAFTSELSSWHLTVGDEAAELRAAAVVAIERRQHLQGGAERALVGVAEVARGEVLRRRVRAHGLPSSLAWPSRFSAARRMAESVVREVLTSVASFRWMRAGRPASRAARKAGSKAAVLSMALPAHQP